MLYMKFDDVLFIIDSPNIQKWKKCISFRISSIIYAHGDSLVGSNKQNYGWHIIVAYQFNSIITQATESDYNFSKRK